FRSKEDNGRKYDKESGDANQVMYRIERMERDAVQRAALTVFRTILDFHAVRVVRAHFVQGDDVRDHQPDEDERNGNHMESEETVECCIGYDVVAADPDGKLGSNERNGRKQVDDNLGAPV